MPTARWNSGAVYIPGVGVLVVGGSAPNNASSTPERDAEILGFINLDREGEMTWNKINPLLKPRGLISAAYVDDSVIVSSAGEETMEILSFQSGHPGQWTLITVGIDECKMPYFLSSFNGNIILTGMIYSFFSN